MRFPKSLHADGWHTHLHLLRPTLADDQPSWRERRGLHVLAVVIVVGGLLATAGVHIVDDPRPLDVQMTSAMNKAGDTLRQWQGQLSRGLQVSLRAVADGRDTPDRPATLIAEALPGGSAVDREPAVRTRAATPASR